MVISTQQQKRFRTIGHQLKPVVTVSDKGLSEAVLEELNRALEDHELIKVKLAVMDREDKQTLTEALIKATETQLVQRIGKVILIYRPAQKPKEKLSNVMRFQHLT